MDAVIPSAARALVTACRNAGDAAMSAAGAHEQAARLLREHGRNCNEAAREIERALRALMTARPSLDVH